MKYESPKINEATIMPSDRFINEII